VFILRVVLHDWPDRFARRILVRLREAAREGRWRRQRQRSGRRLGFETLESPEINGDRSVEDEGVGDLEGGEEGVGEGVWEWDEGTRLVIADFVLPLACADDFGASGTYGDIRADTSQSHLSTPGADTSEPHLSGGVGRDGEGDGVGCRGERKRDAGEGGVEGGERMLGSPPLLANLGKGSAQAYWMDMTVS
jgi:hypothetical protein